VAVPIAGSRLEAIKSLAVQIAGGFTAAGEILAAVI